MLQGKLTYTTAVVAILFGIAGIIFGWLEPMSALEFILGGFGFFGLRRAVEK